VQRFGFACRAAVLVVAAMAVIAAPASAGAGASRSGGLGRQLRPLIRQVMHQNAIPGAVVLVQTPQGRYLEAFGTRVAGRRVPLHADDEFRVGSNTKTMTGTVILQLVQEGRLRLSDPVSRYLPDVPRGDRITIADLMDMRSGIDTYSNLLWFNRALDRHPKKVWSPRRLVRVGLALPPVARPGSRFFYSNTNTLMLGLIIEKLTHQNLPRVFRERIFRPLHLQHTLLPALTSNRIPGPHPHGYLFGTNVSTLRNPALPPRKQKLAIAGKLLPNDVTDDNPSWGWSAGAAISNAPDLARYVRRLVAGGLIDRRLQRERLRSIRSTDPGNPAAAEYGLAIARFGPLIGHDGSLPGFQSFMGYDPDRRITIVVLCNLQFAPDGSGPANDLTMAVVGALYR
jgi:D-alanyl-D-alanine carboxypeptidase